MSDIFDELVKYKNHEKEKISELKNKEFYKNYKEHCTNIVNSYFQTKAYTEDQKEINFGEDLFNNNSDNNNGQHLHIDE